MKYEWKFQVAIEFPTTNACEHSNDLWNQFLPSLHFDKPRTKSHSSIVFVLFFPLFLRRKGRIETCGMKPVIGENSHSRHRRPSFVQIQPVHPPQARRSRASLWKGIHKHALSPSRTDQSVLPCTDDDACGEWSSNNVVARVHRVANGRNEGDTRVSRAIPRPDREGSGKTRPHSDDSIAVDDRRVARSSFVQFMGSTSRYDYSRGYCVLLLAPEHLRAPDLSTTGDVQGVEPCRTDFRAAIVCQQLLRCKRVIENYILQFHRIICLNKTSLSFASGLVDVKIL